VSFPLHKQVRLYLHKRRHYERNERLVSFLSGSFGELALVMVGAMIVGAWTLLRAVFLIGAGSAPLNRGTVLTVLGAIGVGAYGGVVGGVAYRLARGPSRRLGRAGDYVTGVVVLYAYLAAFGIPAALFTSDDTFRSPAGWIAFLVIGTLLGLVIGHSWFRTRT